MLAYDVIIPAANEALTIGEVVRAARAASGAREVIVVDDHSDDDTRGEARRHGARVITSVGRRDKAKALFTGVDASSSEWLVFFDADISNVRPSHFDALAEPLLDGFHMCCGMIDYGAVRNPLFLRLPPITGLRGVRRDVFSQIPHEKLNGFQIEIMINEVIARGSLPTAIRVLEGTTHRSKVQKEGLLRGIRSHARMTLQLLSCFRTVPLWTYGSYLNCLTVLPPVPQTAGESKEAA